MKKQNGFNVGAIINRPQKNDSGITLVALVVTIIILLILAGVSLNLVAGSNGILGKAKNATEISKLAATKEQLQLDLAAAQMDVLANGKMQINNEILTKIISKYGELQEDGDTIITENGNISLKEMYQNSTDSGTTTPDISGEIDNAELAKLATEIQTLKTKVGALETANNAVQSELNTLKISDTSMQTSITALENSLSPTSYTKPTLLEGVNSDRGGYCKIGTLVVVDMTFNVDTSVKSISTDGGAYAVLTKIMSGFPCRYWRFIFRLLLQYTKSR